jgi:hypothetical protein
MNYTDWLELAKYTVPSLIVLITAILVMRSYTRTELTRRRIELRSQHFKDSLPIRMQAYERMVLFLERITPTNLISRVNKQGMSARELHLALLSNIKAEFEHNLSQQLYVSLSVWMMIVQVKEEIVAIINQAAAQLPESATGKDLSRSIIEYFINNEQVMPTQKALDTLKTEVQKIF